VIVYYVKYELKVIPIRDTIPSRQFPVVNTILIVVNSLVFFYELSLGNSLDSFIKTYGLIPDYLGKHNAFLIEFTLFLHLCFYMEDGFT